MSSAALYADFFGLRERPFKLAPDPDFIFWSDQHRKAFTVLEYGILTHAPITLVTGEIGAGKTTLVQALLRRLEDDLTVGLVSNAQGGRGELLSWVLGSLDIEMAHDSRYADMFSALQRFLLDEYAAGRRVVLIFDEAQNLSAEGIEELRMLTNINTGKDELIQLILVGQPELRDMVRAPEMRQLAQRISASFHLGRMDGGMVAEYITHRLRHVGGSGREFTPQACERIAEISEGVPRLVNQLADMSMLYAWSKNSGEIGVGTVESVLADGLFIWDRPDLDEGAAGAGAGAPAAPSGGPASERSE
jgi:type II secretory pathway predicted ATPase ExeA